MTAAVTGGLRDQGGLPSRLQEQLADLADAVLLARMMPGQRMTRAAFAGLGRCAERDLDALLPALVNANLVSTDGEMIVARPLDKDAMFATLPERMALEIKIVRAATLAASDAQIVAIDASQRQQHRCASLGDIDGLIRAERELEQMLVDASGLHADGERLKAIKQEFRRAWCAVNRLRDVTNVADIRTALVAAIKARDPDAAEAQTRVFFDHLVRTY
jgi:DNA-binding FadR family transcriptional regulator